MEGYSMSKFKPTITFDDDSKSIRASAAFMSENSWSYLQRLKIKHKQASWHGPIKESIRRTTTKGELLMSPKLARALNIDEHDKIEIGHSHSEPILNLQVEKTTAQKDEQLPTLVEGIEISSEMLFKWEDETYKVLSCDPSNGYLDTNSIMEDISVKDASAITSIQPISNTKKISELNGFAKLVGIKSIEAEIRKKILYPMQNPEQSQRLLGTPLKGAILYGPYGNGKTAISRAISEEAGMDFIHLSISDLSTPILGEMVIKNAIENAALKEPGAIIFIDELDTVAPKNSEFSIANITPTLQEAMDGFSQNPKVFFLSATNHPNNIAEPLLRAGRFDVLIEISLPNEENRKKLWTAFTSEIDTDSGLNCDLLAMLSSSYTISDIQTVVKLAGLDALNRESGGEKDSFITQKDLVSNIESFKPTGARILGVRRPGATFDQLLGSESFIKQLTPKLDLISGVTPSTHTKLEGATILLYGPPGTGKTHTAKAIAQYLGANFVGKSGASFSNKWVGETERSIRKLFNDARTYRPVVIFIDEIEALAKNRDSTNNFNNNALNQLLVELEGFEPNKGIYFIGATNRRQDLDPAFLSRMKFLFELPLPNQGQRYLLFKGFMDGLPARNINYDRLARLSDGLSQRDIKAVIDILRMKLDLREVYTITTSTIESLILTPEIDVKPKDTFLVKP